MGLPRCARNGGLPRRYAPRNDNVISNQDKKMFKQKFATFYKDMPYNTSREDYCISCNLMAKFYLWSNYLF